MVHRLVDMTPHERVFGSLRNFQKTLKESSDLNTEREMLLHSLDNVLSWESQLQDIPSPSEKEGA